MAKHDPLLLQRPTEYRHGEMSHSWQGGETPASMAHWISAAQHLQLQ